MRIALVLDAWDRRTGGLANWTIQLASFLTARGHDVHVVAFESAEPALPVTVHILPGGGSIFDRAARIAACLAALAVDVVHDTGTGWSGDVFQPQAGSRLTAFYQDTAGLHGPARLVKLMQPRMLWWQLCLFRLERRQIQAASQVIAVSHLVARLLTARYRIPPSRIAVIHNGIDTERFSPGTTAPRRNAARLRLKLRDEVTFVMIAHNFRLKNLDTVLHAMASLPRTAQGPVLLVAGGAPDAFWHGMVARLGLADQVRFCGNMPDPVDVYAAADCLVHPTRWDACSLATLEALACELPVITTTMNGAAEAVVDGQSGFVINNPDDAATLAERMSRLLDTVLRTRMGVAARAASLAFDRTAQFAAVERALAEAADIRAQARQNLPAARL